jgi:hypothetical protein
VRDLNIGYFHPLPDRREDKCRPGAPGHRHIAGRGQGFPVQLRLGARPRGHQPAVHRFVTGRLTTNHVYVFTAATHLPDVG